MTSSMADWVHCNTCFSLPGSGKLFSLTSCGHIYCSDCVNHGTQISCKVCGNPCSTINLTAHLKPDVEIYFMDPQELLKRNMKQLQQVISFQNGHRMRLSAHYRQQMSQIDGMKREMKRTIEHLRELERKVSKLGEENYYLKQIVSPGKRSNQSPISWNSDISSTKGSIKSYLDIQKNSVKSAENQQFCPLSVMKPSNNPTSSMPGRITVRTPPINGHIGIIRGTPQCRSSSITPSSSQRSTSTCTPNSLTPLTPKVSRDGSLHSPMRCSSLSQLSIRNPLQEMKSLQSPVKSNASSSRSTPTMLHKPIQLKQDFRHPGLVRKARVLPYSPDFPNELLRSEE